MIEIFDVGYNLLSDNRSRELFSLRKKTFKDRLDWIVNCENNMEFDAYDDRHTTYVFGTYKDQVICSLRFIETKNPNMITCGEFNEYFNNISLPEGNYVEASRLFIDKERVRALELRRQPISSILFLSMINYARNFGYQAFTPSSATLCWLFSNVQAGRSRWWKPGAPRKIKIFIWSICR